ncbi:hypothetical protein EL22_05090 [Halostagnicola sp. A56]|uniref:DUF1152 domain-containing protein n=1 Tax=Halostagnicola sp. A56 TaxID=1495067 RepID=UPI00049F9342|nr:DUF1152 domain-containing protein [Halostagnicola sp. A56]KDE58402.1 hypothetical protein EL22_05090 [Halostagnicola sp. A56]
MQTLEDIFNCDRALVFGVGGSGDVVGSIPTARLLETHGIETILGGVTWEPVPYDSKPGPRSFDEIENIDRVSETVGLVTEQTATKDALEFTETRVARHYDEPVALLSMEAGTTGMTRGIDAACDELDIDLVIGVDAGGDALAAGHESGLRSPVTDGFGLAALKSIAVDSCLGVIGYGSDGELTIAEFEAAIARAAKRDGLLGSWGITPRVRNELEDLLSDVDTEASRLPVEAANGNFGSRPIRGGELTVDVRAPSTVTFYFDPDAVAASSNLSELVEGTDSLAAAVKRVNEAGYKTEFDREQERLDTAIE